MYKVYRYRDGAPQEVVASFGTLREAYAHARHMVVSERKSAKAFRILGPLPPSLQAGSANRRSTTDTPEHLYWFVLDGVVTTRGALIASAILRRIDEKNAREASISTSACEHDTQYPPAHDAHAGNSPRQIRRGGAYRVDREAHGVRLTLRDDFTSQGEAMAYIERRKKTERDPEAFYVIVSMTNKPQSAKQPVGIRERYQRGAPRLRGERARAKRQRERRDWEIEDRKSDASLASRSEEELGLGIPAQWGKGRRSRKGDYIP
jgi:hypothetical protein